MNKIRVLPFVIAASLSVAAAPQFFLPDAIYAVPGIECNVYFKTITDSITPQNYAYEAKCPFGKNEKDRWTWTPKSEDAGTNATLVLRMWNDDGIVAATTCRVEVAPLPADTSRKLTLALLGDSITNCRYQDQVMKLMRVAGYTNYLPVGSHSGWSASKGKLPGEAAHDGYGGYSWNTFLTLYALSEREWNNIQSEQEKDQLKHFMRKGDVPDWREALLRSPLVRITDGKKIVDVQNWFDKINGGAAPDVILIELGANDMFLQTEDGRDRFLAERKIPEVMRLLDTLRAAAPDAVIAVTTVITGADQDSFGCGYGSIQTDFTFRRNTLAYGRAILDLFRRRGDPKIVMVPIHQSVDPRASYITHEALAHARSQKKIVRDRNALHPLEEGGLQIGDAIYAWLRNALATGPLAE